MNPIISLDLNEIPELKEYVENANEEEVNELVKESLVKYLENGAKNEENRVDKWIRILNELVEWANTENKNLEGDL